MRPLMLLFALAIVSACSRKPPYTIASYGQNQPSKPFTTKIDVYSASRPDRPIRELGEVTTTATNPDVAMRFILNGAREMGADGVVLMGSAAVAHSRSVFPGKATKFREYGRKAIAFVYTD